MTLLLPKESGGDFELTPAGTHVAACYRVVDLGTQQIDWQGKPKHQHKIMISWELADCPMQDGRPFTQHQRYTLSASPKSNLRPHLEAWRGVPFSDADFGAFDIGNLIGKPCLLGIIHEPKDGKVYANISSIMRLPKGMNAAPLVNETIYFSLNDFEQSVFEKLSEGLQAVIAKSPEYQELKGAHRVEQDTPDEGAYGAKPPFDDDIPF